MKLAAKHREYDTEIFQDKIIIPANSLRTIFFEFKGGDELEVIFELKIKQELPIDVWFMNDENYNRFIAGGEFLYFIDGSEGQVVHTKRVAVVTDYDTYLLLLANYNNQTVDVDIVYDPRIYKTESSESTDAQTFISNLVYPLLITVIILVILLIILLFKTRKIKQELEFKSIKKERDKKGKYREVEQKKVKYKEKLKKAQSKKIRDHKTSQKSKTKAPAKKFKSEDEPLAKDTTKFCGYCGKSVNTPYCKFCGRKI